MTKSIIIIIVLAVYAITALAVVMVMIVRKKRSAYDDSPDFITQLADKKREEIEGYAGGMPFKVYMGLSTGLPAVIFLLAVAGMNDMFGPAIITILSIFMPNLIIRIMASRKQAMFDERYSRALRALASDLKSGMSIQQAVEEVSTNRFIHQEIREGYKQISSDIKTGLPVEEAFKRYTEEYDTPDTRDVASSITMQAEFGGSEAKMIELVSENIRSRTMLRKEVKALFADTELMSTMMDILPFLALAILYFAARDLIQPYFESTGMTIVFIGIIVFMFVGSVYTKKKLVTAKRGSL